MIKKFVEPNPMSRWDLKEKTRKKRENAVEVSYTLRKELEAQGRFDYIPKTKGEYELALERKTEMPRGFSGLLADKTSPQRVEEPDVNSQEQPSLELSLVGGNPNILRQTATTVNPVSSQEGQSVQFNHGDNSAFMGRNFRTNTRTSAQGSDEPLREALAGFTRT